MSNIGRLAVVGATGAYGEALLRVLEARGVAAELSVVASEQSVGRQIEFRGEEYAVASLERFDFGQVDVALFALPAELSRHYAPLAAEAGAVVIDGSSAFADQADVPLVAAGFNDDALDGYRDRQIVRSPAPAALMLLPALAPLARSVGLLALDVAGYHAVVGAGRAAIDELAAQCGQLLNGRPVSAPGPVFRDRVAFNCIVTPAAAGSGPSELERWVEADLRALLAAGEFDFGYTAAWVPAFYGDALAVGLTTREPTSAAAIARLWAVSPELVAVPGEAPPSPAGQGADQDEVFVSRLRQRGGGRGQSFWAVADPLRRSATNSVRLVEVLAREHF